MEKKSKILEKFQQQCLKAHNDFRSCHGADKLVLNDTLSEEAQNWAEKMAKKGTLSHSQTKHGENVAYRSEEVPGDYISRMWYDEIGDYSWDIHGSSNGKAIGHFTQVVWKGTKEVGFGCATGDKGFFAVGTYKPAGNFLGQYKDNVGKKTGVPGVPSLEEMNSKRLAEKGSGSSNSESKTNMPKPGTTEETKIEFVTEDGQRKKKTITTITTVTETPGGGYKTSTKTRTQTETLPPGYDESEVTKGIGKLKTRDSDSNSDSDSDDDVNDMSRNDKRKFREELVDEINSNRRKHGASRLKKSRRLQRKAQKHAHKMLRDDDLKLLEGVHGQSLSMMQPRPKGKDIASQWYGEKDGYDFSKPQFTKGAGNFTQMVWKDSEKIGVGVASNKAGATYIIALFDPPGNVENGFASNVKKA